ncbi:sarcosine oxidase subunit gamma [Arthrobacter alpinus]|uniref:Sarcosine oxidase subunit gamma n=1 Tax=Arthrobacter alpinus TaxID=656366 RepID=A0A0M4QWM4_9MICC|nr:MULTISPECIES: sarcosine oxidase subunit gamma family protein [Arthrobacter]ALE91377.1 sarcosine oxidase subunit gamma [Arthrobacter alpinus]
MVNTAANANVQALRRSPAAHLWTDFEVAVVVGEYGVALREIPFQRMVGIRVDPLSEAGQRIGARTGGLPASCGQVTAGPGGVNTLWLGPDEFLTIAPDDGGADGGGLAASLVEALGDGAGQAIELSSNRTTFELAGPSARAVLEKSCAADLHPRSFATGTAITTEIGKIPTILWKTGDDAFLIFPRASFADYLGRWLLDGMREFAAGNTSWH